MASKQGSFAGLNDSLSTIDRTVTMAKTYNSCVIEGNADKKREHMIQLLDLIEKDLRLAREIVNGAPSK